MSVHIGKVVRDAVVFNFRNPQGGSVSDSALLDALDRLFILLEARRIDYLLVGGIALLQYVEGRNTEDIALLMALSSVERLPEIRDVHKEGSDFARVALYETDILTLMQQFDIDPEPLFGELKEHLSPTDLDALRQITIELRARISRFGQTFQ